MKFLTSDKAGNGPEVTLCHRSIDHLEHCDQTHAIVGVPMSLILLLFESCQFTTIDMNAIDSSQTSRSYDMTHIKLGSELQTRASSF